MIVSYGETSPIDPTRRAIGQYNYAPQPQQEQSYQQPQALQQLGMQQQPYQQEPQALQQFGVPQQPYQQEQQQPQALQQMGMQQQSYRPLPQMPTMSPFLQQFRMQQRPYQSPFQQRSGQMSPDGTMGNRSGSAYSYSNNSQLNNLAPLNMNALNFSY